jgi:hypothetical protein
MNGATIERVEAVAADVKRPRPGEGKAFTYLATRSAAVSAAVALVVAVESVALHLWLAARYPGAAWTLTAVSFASLAWLAADYRAIARRPVIVGPDALHVRVGLRFAATIPRALIAAVEHLTWRTVPPRAADYLNTAGISEPNVVLHFTEPVPVRVLGLLTRRVTRLGVRLDDPGSFVDALG